MKSIHRSILGAGAASLLLLGTAACASDTDAPASEEKPASITVGLVNADMLEFHTCLEKGITTQAKELGIELITSNSARDPGKELSNVEDMIVRGVDAILLQTVNIDSLEGAVAKANAAEIPIFLTSVIGPEANNILGAVLSDVQETGHLSGEWLSKDADGKKVKAAIIAGAPGAASDLFVKGFKESLDSNVEVVFEQPGMFQRAKAQEVAENLLQANPDVHYVFVPNEEMAFGALTAFTAAGRDDIKILVNGGTPAGLDAVKSGEFALLVASSPATMGAMALESIKVLLADATAVEKVQSIPLTPVTTENLAAAPSYCG